MGEIDLDFVATVFTRIGALEARCDALQGRVAELEARPAGPDLNALGPVVARFLAAVQAARAGLVNDAAEADE